METLPDRPQIDRSALTNADLYPDMLRQLHDDSLVTDGSNPNQAPVTEFKVGEDTVVTSTVDPRNMPDAGIMGVGIIPVEATTYKPFRQTKKGAGSNDAVTQGFIQTIRSLDETALFPTPKPLEVEGVGEAPKLIASMVRSNVQKGLQSRHAPAGGKSRSTRNFGERLARAIEHSDAQKSPPKAVKKFNEELSEAMTSVHTATQAARHKMAGNYLSSPEKDSEVHVEIQKRGISILPKKFFQRRNVKRAAWAEDAMTAAALKHGSKRRLGMNKSGYTAGGSFVNPLKPSQRTFERRMLNGANTLEKIYSSNYRQLENAALKLIDEHEGTAKKGERRLNRYERRRDRAIGTMARMGRKDVLYPYLEAEANEAAIDELQRIILSTQYDADGNRIGERTVGTRDEEPPTPETKFEQIVKSNLDDEPASMSTSKPMMEWRDNRRIRAVKREDKNRNRAEKAGSKLVEAKEGLRADDVSTIDKLKLGGTFAYNAAKRFVALTREGMAQDTESEMWRKQVLYSYLRAEKDGASDEELLKIHGLQRDDTTTAPEPQKPVEKLAHRNLVRERKTIATSRPVTAWRNARTGNAERRARNNQQKIHEAEVQAGK